jgi:hypothetical protein
LLKARLALDRYVSHPCCSELAKSIEVSETIRLTLWY